MGVTQVRGIVVQLNERSETNWVPGVDVTGIDTPLNLLLSSLLCLTKYTIQVHRLHPALNSDRLVTRNDADIASYLT